ncbi:MAG: hypothetical protein IJ349_00440 [Clostridia bacterium]|nr:hypothetical protein [Clostridia bacterium]
MDKIKEFWESFDETTRKALCIVLPVIMLFSSGYFVGSLTSNRVGAPAAEGQQSVQVDATDAPEQTTAVPVEATTAAPSEATTAATQQSAAPSTGAYTTPEEIVALFNESAGKIKTTAKRATRNYQDMKINKLEVPGALQSLADSAVAKYVKPNMTPEVYEGTEAVKEKYPVSGTDFASKLKVEYVDTITCTDNGTEYVIDIKMKDQMNPVYRSGEGVGSIFWTMNIDDIANNVPGLQKAELSYYNCTATAKIDKATGNMIYSRFIYNFDMILEVKMLATLNANASLTVDEEYTIEY